MVESAILDESVSPTEPLEEDLDVHFEIALFARRIYVD